MCITFDKIGYPTIKSERLILTELSEGDISTIVKYAGSKKVAEMTLNIPHPYQEKDARFWINSARKGFENKTQFTFGIKLNYNKAFIGGIGLKYNNRFNRGELGYWVGEPFWNKGYASEAVGLLLKYGFEKLNINKIFALHLLDNPASGKVMIKNGMIKEGKLIDHTKKGNDYKTLIQYRLTNKEYKEIKMKCY